MQHRRLEFAFVAAVAVAVALTAFPAAGRTATLAGTDIASNPQRDRRSIAPLDPTGRPADSAAPAGEDRDNGRIDARSAAPGLTSGLGREAWTSLQNEIRRRARPASVTAVSEVGGTDVLVGTSDYLFYSAIDVASNGDIYVAVQDLELNPHVIRVWRSTDGGNTWSVWGTISNGGNNSFGWNLDLHIAEGSPARVFVCWHLSTEARVAYSPLGGPSASWTAQTAITLPGGFVHNVRITSDADEYPIGYFVYLIAGELRTGGAVRLARSIDQGNTYEPPYVIGTASGGAPAYPAIDYANDILHVAWHADTPTEWRVEHRRATNYAASISDWGPINVLLQSPRPDTTSYSLTSIAASRVSNNVALSVVRYGCQLAGCSPPDEHDVIVRTSSDGGLTWPPGNEVRLLELESTSLEAAPGGGFALVGTRRSPPHDIVLCRATDALPLEWDRRVIVDRPTQFTIARGMPDPSHGGQVAVTWNTVGVHPDSLWVDAEWRGAPGVPNIEGGGPWPLFAGGATPPALGELDGDPQLEIVFGAEDGFIEAFNHDGTIVPGWPQFTGLFPPHIPRNATIAVSDLDLDGRSEVIAGDASGNVHVRSQSGAPRPGWPVSISGDPVFVSVGRFSSDMHGQIVAVTTDQVTVLEPDGSVAPGWPNPTAGLPAGAAAIGDVDDDGTIEIVVASASKLQIFAPDGTTEAVLGVAGTISDQPSLADMDVDGDLEIAVPTIEGVVHFIHHSGAPLAGTWPFVGSTATPIPSVALAHMRANDIDAVVAERDGVVHMLDASGAEWSGWPNTTSTGWFLIGGPTVDYVEGASPDAVIGGRGSEGYGWDNLGSAIGGWPVGLAGQCEVSPASADIDQDGHLEVVFVTHTHLHVFDVGNPPRFTDIASTWPMYGHDAERTACLACQDGVFPVAVDPPAGEITRLRLAAPYPSPSTGHVTFDFAVPTDAHVRLDVIDVSGRRIGTLLSREVQAGSHRWTWNGLVEGHRLPAGIYFARLDAGAESTSRRVVVLP